MARTTVKVQQYVGCLLSMARATLYDHPTYDEAIDKEALDIAITIIHNMMTSEIRKNINRQKGEYMLISEIGLKEMKK